MSKLAEELWWLALNGHIDQAIKIIKARPGEKQVKLLSEPKLVWFLSLKGGAPAIIEIICKKQIKAQKRILNAPWAEEEGLINCGQKEAVERIKKGWKSAPKRSNLSRKAPAQTKRKKPAP